MILSLTRLYMKRLQKAMGIFDRILDLLVIFAGILVVFSTLSVAVGIFSRFFLNHPIAWVTEISEYIILYVTFLVAAWILRQEEHVKMDILLNLFGQKTQAVINIVTSIFCVVACIILTWFGARVSWELYKTKAFTYTVLELPKFIFISVIFFGGFLLVIQFIRRIHGCLQNLREPQDRENRHKDQP